LEIAVAILEDQSNRARPLIVVAVALLVITVIVLTIVNRPQPTEHWSAEAIRSEYQKIRQPAGVNAVGAPDVVSKYGVNAVSARYDASKTDVSVLPHYRTELTGNGWNYLGDFHAGEHWGESYCKGKLLARVELFDAQGRGGYAFSMSWGEVSERQCP
jgi:hypothetical protein